MMQSFSNKNYCSKCKQELLEAGDYVTLREKGALTITITSKKRNDDINVSSGDIKFMLPAAENIQNLNVWKKG